MNQKRSRLLCLVLSVMFITTGIFGVASAQQSGVDALGSPDINVYAPGAELAPGTSESISLQVSNEGNLRTGSVTDREFVTTARDVAISLDTSGTPIEVNTNSQTIGKLGESDVGRPEFDIVVPDSAKPGNYKVSVNMNYAYTSKASSIQGMRDTTSERTASVTESVKIEITDDAQFEVTEVDSKLYVGEEGRISGRMKNVGGSDATNAEIKFTPTNENINALSSTVAVGDISVDSSVPFDIPVEVTSGAEAVPHRFDLNVNYRDENGISQSTDDPEFVAEIKGDRDAFLVEPVNNTIPAGGSRPLSVRVTNNLNETVSDIEGKFFADDPLDSTNDETFTSSLDPGETTTVTVDLSASRSATLKNYPVSIDFRYVDSEGDSKLTDSYRMAISVTEPETSSGPPIGLLVGLLIVLAGSGYLGWRRGLLDRFTD